MTCLIKWNVIIQDIILSALVVENLPANEGDATDMGSIPGSGRSSGQGSGNPLQHACLENPTGREAWWTTVRGVSEWDTAKHSTAHANPHLVSHSSRSQDFPVGSVVKNPPAKEGDARDTVSVPVSGRSSGVENGNPFHYSCLGNPMDWGAW